MATLQEIRDAANARLTDFWVELVAKQDAYFALHGKYFQKLITNRPVDGATEAWADIVPSDEKHPDDAVLTTAGGPLPFAISVDEWVGPDGPGWSATVWIELANGDIYTRSRDFQNNDTNWSQWVPDVI